MAVTVRQHGHRAPHRARATTLVVAASLFVAVGVAAGYRSPVEAVPIDAGATAAYVPVGPVRLADTRNADCGCTRTGDSTLTVDVAGHPDVPDGIVAAALTITATPHPRPGFVTAYPDGSARPTASTVNIRHDRVVANSTIVPVGANGAVAVFRLVPNDVIVDLTGVWVTADHARAGRFVPVSTRRLVDTRTTGAELPPGGELTIALPDGVDDDATATVVNITSVDDRRPGYLAARPAGSTAKVSSFLNTNGSGQAIAATTIVPVSSDGFTLSSHGGGHVVVDLVGWFTGPSAASNQTGLLVPVAPTRLLDTRATAPRIWPDGTIELASPLAGAAALITNVTVTATDRQGYLTAYPAGTARPPTSAINPIGHDHTIANLAITRVSDRGLSYYALGGTDLIVDLTGYFTGAPIAATEPAPANHPTTPRVLLLGDSALAGLNAYPQSHRALLGFEWLLDAGPCRRLVYPSCLSPATNSVPTTGMQALAAAPGRFDIVYVDAGHNDWHDPDFDWQFDQIVTAARAKGAHTIIWSTYTENVKYDTARAAYIENNANLRRLTALPQYSDVILADWNAYSIAHPDWFYDGTHMRVPGAFAAADYISRWVAAAGHRPCPKPWQAGGPTPDPCPHPDDVGPPASPITLY